MELTSFVKIDPKSQPVAYEFYEWLAMRENMPFEDCAMIFHPDTGKVALMLDMKQSLQLNGIDGLAEEALKIVKKKGIYVNERYPKLQSFPDLLREENFGVIKVSL